MKISCQLVGSVAPKRQIQDPDRRISLIGILEHFPTDASQGGGGVIERNYV